MPYLTFPFANRPGTTILDRSTAYPVFGHRAGRLALSLVRQGAADVVHGFGASVLGYAVARGVPRGEGESHAAMVYPRGEARARTVYRRAVARLSASRGRW